MGAQELASGPAAMLAFRARYCFFRCDDDVVAAPVDAETLHLACYGIVSAAENMITDVVQAAELSSCLEPFDQSGENGVSVSFSRESN